MRFAERFDIPVATSFRRTHVIDPLHPSYAGDLAQRSQSQAARAREGGGPRPPDRRPARRMAIAGLHACSTCRCRSRRSIHVHPGIEELGRVYRPHLAIHATPTAFAAALDQIAAPNDIRWRDETKTAHADYLAFSEKPTAVPGPVNLGEIVVGLRDTLPADAVVMHRRRQFFDLGPALLSLSPIRHAVRAGVRLDGLRPAVGRRHEAADAGAHRGGVLRRRRFHDDRAGVRHRRAIRSADRRDRRRQRHVRHHPHAPGAPPSRPRHRDDAAQSGFRRLRARRSAASA